MAAYLVKNGEETYYRHPQGDQKFTFTDNRYVGRDKATEFESLERAEVVARKFNGLVVSAEQPEIVISDYTQRMIVKQCCEE